MAMLKNLKRKWIKALRSGEYDQDTGVLCSADGKRFCCLGVLADIQGARWEEQIKDTGFGFSYGKSLVLIPVPKEKSKPQKDQDELVLASQLRNGLSKAQQNELAHLNDNNWTFDQIADWIEEHVKTK